MLIGGVVTSYYGGYNNKRAQVLILIVGWTCVLFTLPIPIVSDFKLFGLFFWVMLFLGGFILPSLTGIMLNCVEEN